MELFFSSHAYYDPIRFALTYWILLDPRHIGRFYLIYRYPFAHLSYFCGLFSCIRTPHSHFLYWLGSSVFLRSPIGISFWIYSSAFGLCPFDFFFWMDHRIDHNGSLPSYFLKYLWSSYD